MERTIRPQLRVLLVDDDALFLRSLTRTLGCFPEIEVVGKASSGEESLQILREKNPAVVLMDVKMPGMGGIEATRQIRSNFPGTVVLGLSGHEDRSSIVGIIQAGAAGYVLKPFDGRELVKAIEEVVAGKTYFSKGTFDAVAEVLRNPDLTGSTLVASLTDREKEVLRLVAMGKSTKQIAEGLQISSRTVENHRSTVMLKVNAKNTAELVRFAIREGIAVL